MASTAPQAKAPQFKVTQGAIARAQKALTGLGITLHASPSKQGYNAYLLSMALQAGTQATINANAQQVANVQGLGITIGANNMHPCYHMGHPVTAKYIQAMAVPKVGGTPFTTVQPKCTTHTGHSNCTPACVYGLYNVGQNQFMHLMLVVGVGSKKPTKVGKKAQGTAPVAHTNPNNVPLATGNVAPTPSGSQ